MNGFQQSHNHQGKELGHIRSRSRGGGLQGVEFLFRNLIESCVSERISWVLSKYEI